MEPDELRGRLDSMILAVLERGPSHGYAVIEAVRARTDGQVELTTGSVYPALRRLEDSGHLRGEWSTAAGRRRRTYELTPSGHRRLTTERDRWRTFSAVVARVLDLPAS